MRNFMLFALWGCVGVCFLILSSFVPGAFYEFMKIVNTGVELGDTGRAALALLAPLGAILTFVGHAFVVLNRRVSERFNNFFSFLD